jgi:hypothetical protein
LCFLHPPKLCVNLSQSGQWKPSWILTFSATIKVLIECGLIPFPFVEGGYNHSLDVIAGSDFTKGKVIWWCDGTDMKAAKEKLGGKACSGNEHQNGD